ncbi:lysylphosphatidylglycerol synthase transmembrane domain-containing protein [Mycobacterium spongiae]|uniref:TIGR00374 family protein n=1 Tax=Mycobacterium spongiae TaxID=886343 RepID=A0A975JUM0_9MYCO|nr:YbhN family protein [Mycobacterium spongiae]QUR65956.1 TIGR00374 family protein [Mycobacterium spongiae]
MSHDAASRNLRQRGCGLPRARMRTPPARAGESARGKYWWLRWVVLTIVAIVLAVEVALGWDQLHKAWASMYEANWWWLLAAIAAAGASMHSFAQIQRTLLRSAGVHVKQWRSEAAFYAANSLSTTLPGGPVLSATFLLRQQRMWGASTVVASWQLVMSGVLQAVGLALLGLGGAFFLGAKNNPFSLFFTLGGFVALLLLAQAVASRPELIEGIGRRVLSWANSVRGRPADTGLEKWREILMQLESVSLGRRDLAVAFSWSLFNWIADVACLGFAAYAAGDHASVAGLTVAYAAARAVGTIPLMPGGLLVVEAVLVPGLVSSGMTLPSAISAMLIYRLISWLLIAAIGWVVFFFMFRTENITDPDADPDADESATAPTADPAGSPASNAATDQATSSQHKPSDDPAETALHGPLPPEQEPDNNAEQHC